MFFRISFVGLIVKYTFHHFLKYKILTFGLCSFGSLCLPHLVAAPLLLNIQDSFPVAKLPFYFMDI
jgi:hypothetical protein